MRRQEVYHKVIHAYHAKDVMQILGQVCKLVQNWCPVDLKLSFLYLSRSSLQLLEMEYDV